MKSIASKISALLMLVVTLGSTGCIQDRFDQPPVNGSDPNITPTHSIADIKAMYSGTSVEFTDSMIISGIVNADDKSGNFYKVITMQDQSAGIAIRVDGNSLFNNYPVGRRIYIKLQGLVMGEYNGLIQLGGARTSGSTTEVEPIPQPLLDNFIIKGSLNNPLTPQVVTIGQLNNSMQNMLIRLDSVQFSAGDTNKTYANAVTQQSVNLTVQNCTQQSVILRNSGYADFAADKVPDGRGSLTAIYSVFGTDKQFLIRNTDDVQFTGPRCGSSGAPGTLIAIRDLRAMYTGSATAAPAGRKIKGTVISDRTANNLVSQNVIIQDATGGITVRFGGSHSLSLGQEVEIPLDGGTLTLYAQLMQLENMSASNVTVLGVNPVTPRVATIQQINDSISKWESTLVRINNATVTPGPTFGSSSGNQSMNDGTGSITLYTRAAATFASGAVPAGPATITGVVGRFNSTRQIQMRNASDVQ
ncbi:MAG: hypothetical protein IBJ09_15285 [Bacteroidia bacterium]|nr:hypothetical protein [Bacteroidia bacterium]